MRYLAPTMSLTPRIPYRSLWKTAALTAPLLAIGFVSPILIASGRDLSIAWIAVPLASVLCFVAWTFNIAFLRFRERLGKWKWLQIFIVGGFMIGLSFVGFYFVTPLLPPEAQKLAMIRYLNAFALNTIIYILIYVRLLSDAQSRLAEENAQLRMSSLETQYQILKDQVNPHFLFNALGTARSLARRDPALTEAYIIRLSDFLRVTLQDARDLVPLQEELRLVRDYVELQKMRFHDALVFTCPPELLAPRTDDGTAQYQLPYFSLLTLVENAVKHNVMTLDAPLKIAISIADGTIIVWNNRQPKALHSPSNGSGLNNLRNRCRILGLGEIAVQESAEAYQVTFHLLPL